MPSRTRARAAVADHQHRELIFASLASTDILSCLLPHLAFPAFLALRSTCTELRAATNTACKDVAKVLRHAAELYVSPRFLEALRLVADHRRPLSWMLLTPALPVVYGEAYGDLVAAAYHLLQAHLTRVQKLRLSNLLRRAARQCIGPEHCEARCWLAHLAVHRSAAPVHRADSAVHGQETRCRVHGDEAVVGRRRRVLSTRYKVN